MGSAVCSLAIPILESHTFQKNGFQTLSSLLSFIVPTGDVGLVNLAVHHAHLGSLMEKKKAVVVDGVGLAIPVQSPNVYMQTREQKSSYSVSIYQFVVLSQYV
ncbi:hypothetical protein BOTBODRAFT_31770 [Botryobasidium botryosum FD-172 SS1]|uniref:Uncharacterized protein n=1 Tax=Botryobasidium botryosum (strain FD-172 SS1) TaxID=930990 RepID=A0A067ML49_BOTB1|nr:hypothetical protein BOTBODRAFT_31770 [Botryobasidium botryosum FD-172 SS1]